MTYKRKKLIKNSHQNLKLYSKKDMIEGSKKESPVFPGGSDCKELPAMWETQVRSLAWEDPLEESMATHYSSLAWIILWTEEPGGLQSMGFQRVRHN